MTQKNLYDSMGFKSNPFSKFSAEEEVAYLNEIYYKPKYFQSILNDIKAGSSRFIFGERGSGKSALLLELNKELSQNNYFTVIVDDFDDIPTENNDFPFALLLFKRILKQYVICLSKNPHLVDSLNPIQKEKLAVFIKEFFSTISRTEFESSVSQIAEVKVQNFFKRLYNKYLNKPLNLTISIGVELTGDLLRSNLGLPNGSSEIIYRNYLPEIKIDDLKRKGFEKQLKSDKNYNKVKEMIVDLAQIIQSSGYTSSVFFFDKIDEFKKVSGKIHKIVDFTKSILKDTELLYKQEFSLVFSLWSEVKSHLNESGVRFDKFKPVDINWSLDEMREILKNRVQYFAIQKEKFDLNNYLTPKVDLDKLLELSNKSPRDMTRLFSFIYDEQEILDSSSSIFSHSAIQKGTIKYCKEYDYYSIYPCEKDAKDDIKFLIGKLLKMSLIDFSNASFMTTFSYSGDQARYYIETMKDSCLIKDDESVDNKYIIIEPKIRHLILSGYQSLN